MVESERKEASRLGEASCYIKALMMAAIPNRHRATFSLMLTVKVNLGFIAGFPLSRTGAAHNGLRRSIYIAPLLALDLAELASVWSFRHSI